MRRCALSNIKRCQTLDIVVNLYHALLYLVGTWVDLTDECIVCLRCQIVQQSPAIIPEQLVIRHSVKFHCISTNNM